MNENILLAIDTATDQAGISVFDGSCLDEVAWSTCRDQTVNILSQIDHLLRRAKVEITQVGAVAVTTGPGRFTSLRVGLSIAKGLVVAQDAAVIGIPTLQAVVWPYRFCFCSTIAVVPAGRQRYVWACYPPGENGNEVVGTETGTTEDFAEYLRLSSEPLVVTGEFGSEVITLIDPLENVSIVSQSGRLGRAGAAAEIAWYRWQNGDVDDPVAMTPNYLHTQPATAMST
jgi:tRNA threonylcarbamoyladenosine biosynthesis protein TsaB